MIMDHSLFQYIVSAPFPSPQNGDTIGFSRKGRPIKAFCHGSGDFAISLIGGLYADEPLGPRFLRHYTTFLGTLPPDHPLLTRYQWWIIPHANPDGEITNSAWTEEANGYYHLSRCITFSERESPGDDMEYGFPFDDNDKNARPENKAIYRWWETSNTPFRLHLSCHGMLFGQGPWFLIDRNWLSKCKPLINSCTALTEQLGYQLHDVNRKGEKGFSRISRGFSTRPDSRYMKEYYINLRDPETAAKFRPSSMETIRKISGNTLTLVPAIPLFLVPDSDAGDNQSGFSARKWKEQFEIWRRDGNAERIEHQARQMDVRPMPILDQMKLLLTFMTAGIELVKNTRE